MAVKSRGHVYLKGGHHRAAILKVPGYQAFPWVVVLPRSLFALVRLDAVRSARWQGARFERCFRR